MVNNNYKEQNKIALVNQVNKALNVVLSKRNINNGFKITWVWRNFNPKAMDGKTKPNELFITEDNIIIIDEKNVEYFDEGLDNTQYQGEHGASIELINIDTTKEPFTIGSDDDVQKLPLRYYVEEPRSLVILEDT